MSRIGVVRETKADEHRVAITPAGTHALIADGHTVLVERGAGAGSLITDEEYSASGAVLVDDPGEVWAGVDLMVKVKEPQADELVHLRHDLTLFTYLHLAAYPAVAAALVGSGGTAIAYETVQDADGSLPLLAPMSEIAGRMAAQVGAHLLERYQGGRGVLLGGAAGVAPAKVVVIGAGVAGMNAAGMCAGLLGDVTVFDLSPGRLREIERIERGRIRTRMSSPMDLTEAVLDAELVIGAVLVAGDRAPRLLDVDVVDAMKSGAVLIDISIDQGGCFATSRETSHSDPTYLVGDVVHYCVGNIPGAVPRTSTFALTAATLPFVRTLAALGSEAAAASSASLAGGVNVRRGELVHPTVRAAITAVAA